MMVEDQSEVIAFLARMGPHIDTHTASVFLAPRRAYKLKRAVRYDYLDYSTSEARRAACESEVRINRRTAPSLYVGVEPVVRRADGALAIGGNGRPLDWLVVMQRFEQEQMLDRMAQQGRLTAAIIERLAERIAAFHAAAEVRRDFGGAGAISLVIEGNHRALAEQERLLTRDEVDHLTNRLRACLSTCRALLDERRVEGMVRHCHGDLHLRNIVLIDDQPTLFDAVEFNEEFSCIDVLYDVAFLLMDLLARRLPEHASTLFNHYVRSTGDLLGLRALPLFLSCRAAIRAKTSLAAAALAEGNGRVHELNERARQYLGLASRLLTLRAPRLVAVGGFSGTGKSTLARQLAPALGTAPGALVLRTDEVRREIFGSGAGRHVPDWAYAPAVRGVVYADVRRQARHALDAGYSVVADAVFADAAERRAIEDVAHAANVPFTGVWLDAAVDVLERRLDARRGDASDATHAVLHEQLLHGASHVNWHRIDANGPSSEAVQQVQKVLTELQGTASSAWEA